MKAALINLLFNFPQLTRAKIVIRIFVPGGHKQLTTEINAIFVLNKVTQECIS